MNKINKSDLIKLIVVIVFTIVLILALYLRTKNNDNADVPNDLFNVCVSDDCFLVREELVANAWNGLEVYVDGKEYDEYPTIYGDITIGSDVKDVFKVFDIKPGYAYINMEVSGGEDGTTDIKELVYENFDFLEENYLDAYVIFGYKKGNDKYVMVESSVIEEYLEEEKTEDLDILFSIDLNGMMDEEVDEHQVIAISIKVIK